MPRLARTMVLSMEGGELTLSLLSSSITRVKSFSDYRENPKDLIAVENVRVSDGDGLRLLDLLFKNVRDYQDSPLWRDIEDLILQGVRIGQKYPNAGKEE